MNEDNTFDLGAFRADLAQAGAALADFAQGPAREAAEDISEAFERAGKRIAATLGRAGADGEASMKRLAKIILEELAKIAIERVSGAGSWTAGPWPAQRIGNAAQEDSVRRPGAGGPVNVHFHLGAGADAQSLVRHQGQIAAAIARAVAYGRRNL